MRSVQMGHPASLLYYASGVAKKAPLPPTITKTLDETYVLTRPRKGAKLKEEVWQNSADGKVVKYSLAYINPRICGSDNGRVLGYDNSHLGTTIATITTTGASWERLSLWRSTTTKI
jgi:hypothetical protein